MKAGVFEFLHLQKSRDKHVFIGPQQLPSCDEIIMHMQEGYSHGTWGGQLELGWKGKGWDGVCCFCTRVALCTNTLLPQESAKRRREEKEDSSLHPVLPPLHLHKQWEAVAAPSFTLTPANPSMASFPLSSTSSHRNGFIC